MSVFTDIWRQLVRRRLWPVALLLLAALAAVPVVLAKQPEATPPAAVPANAGPESSSTLAAEPIVALGEPVAAGKERVPLGKKHDIFKPTKKAPKVVKEKEPKASATTHTPKQETTPQSSGGSSGGTGTTPTPTAPATEPEPPKTYPPLSLRVRFNGVKRTLPRLTALPSAEAPQLVYMGLTDRGKTAVFMLDSTLTAQGDGSCHPSPLVCETVQLRVGDTEFFDLLDDTGAATGEGFQLDLLKINKGKADDEDEPTRSTKLARASRVVRAAGFSRTLRSGLGSATRTR